MEIIGKIFNESLEWPIDITIHESRNTVYLLMVQLQFIEKVK